jgi:hypothetical protein
MQPAEVRKAWEQHGKHDRYSSMDDMRALAVETLPGATVSRRLLWRYTLVYIRDLGAGTAGVPACPRRAVP